MDAEGCLVGEVGWESDGHKRAVVAAGNAGWEGEGAVIITSGLSQRCVGVCYRSAQKEGHQRPTKCAFHIPQDARCIGGGGAWVNGYRRCARRGREGAATSQMVQVLEEATRPPHPPCHSTDCWRHPRRLQSCGEIRCGDIIIFWREGGKRRFLLERHT